MNETNDDEEDDDTDYNKQERGSSNPSFLLDYPTWAIYPIPEMHPKGTLPKNMIDNKYIGNVITSGKVIKVYDGHNIMIFTKIPENDNIEYKIPLRLSGILSPKFKSKSEGERELAWISRNALYSMIYGKQITLQNVYIEKYGKIYADVFCEGTYINAWMIAHGYAIYYTG
jgi:endonuclease YncB( thermonuclease family)